MRLRLVGTLVDQPRPGYQDAWVQCRDDDRARLCRRARTPGEPLPLLTNGVRVAASATASSVQPRAGRRHSHEQIVMTKSAGAATGLDGSKRSAEGPVEDASATKLKDTTTSPRAGERGTHRRRLRSPEDVRVVWLRYARHWLVSHDVLMVWLALPSSQAIAEGWQLFLRINVLILRGL